MLLEGDRFIHHTTEIVSHTLRITSEVSRHLHEIYTSNVGYIDKVLQYMRIDSIGDPFYETKKKCLPENIDHLHSSDQSSIVIENVFFVTIPFTIEKRDGASFLDPTMNNLIIDDDKKLIQLLYGGSAKSVLRTGQTLMQVTEYTHGRKTVARKFKTYTICAR